MNFISEIFSCEYLFVGDLSQLVYKMFRFDIVLNYVRPKIFKMANVNRYFLDKLPAYPKYQLCLIEMISRIHSPNYILEQ